MREDTFDDLVRRHTGAVTAYARALRRDRWHAEEAVQETFLRAWQYLDSYDRRGSFEGWLIRICRNCVIDLAHRDEREADQHVDDHTDHADVAVGPDHDTELHDRLARLPIVQREVLVLCRLLGYGYDSAAIILDVPVGTVRSRLSRARDNLEALLRGEDAEERSA